MGRGTTGAATAGGQLPGESDARVSRRALLRAGTLGGGAAATLAVGGVAAAGARASVRRAPAAARPFELFAQADLNFETLFTLGSAGYGVSEVGEVVTAVNEINARGASYQAYFDGFAALARRVASLADSELAAGHDASARSAYLRAASYFDACLFFVLGTSYRAHEASVYAAMQRNWDRAARLFDPPFVRVRIPYGRSWLPGYLLRPDYSAVRRPTVVLNNGSDAQNVDLYAFGGAAALERGYNALIFEGPGQGSVLFEREIFFRADWEHVVSPIVDWLSGLPYVDSSRIAITGWSLCGESVIRAAAFEHRLAAVVADPGVLNAWLAYPADIRELFDNGAPKAEVNYIWNTDVVPHLSASDRFTLAKRSELFGRPYLMAGREGKVFADLYDLGQTVMQVNCEATAGLVTSPALITDYELDEFVGSQAPQVFRRLGDIPRELHTFTVAEGAEYHDAPMAPQTRNQVVFDWLDDTVS